MKISSLVVAGFVGVFASPTLHAQTITPMSLNNGWTSFNGCHIEPVVITLPGGAVYYAAGFAPILGGYMLGLCGVWPGINSPAFTPPGGGGVNPRSNTGGTGQSVKGVFDE